MVVFGFGGRLDRGKKYIFAVAVFLPNDATKHSPSQVQEQHIFPVTRLPGHRYSHLAPILIASSVHQLHQLRQLAAGHTSTHYPSAMATVLESSDDEVSPASRGRPSSKSKSRAKPSPVMDFAMAESAFAFRCRGHVTSRGGDPPREGSIIIDFATGIRPGSERLSVRSFRGGKPSSNAPTNCFFAENCVHVTEKWERVVADTAMVVQFAKGGVGKERTGWRTLTIRAWAGRAQEDVKRVWRVMREAVERTGEVKVGDKGREARRALAGRLEGVIGRKNALVAEGKRDRPAGKVDEDLRRAERAKGGYAKKTASTKEKLEMLGMTKPAIVKPFRGNKYGAMATGTQMSLGRGNPLTSSLLGKRSVANAIVGGGLVGPPPDADKDLVVGRTKRQRMQTRKPVGARGSQSSLARRAGTATADLLGSSRSRAPLSSQKYALTPGQSQATTQAPTQAWSQSVAGKRAYGVDTGGPGEHTEKRQRPSPSTEKTSAASLAVEASRKKASSAMAQKERVTARPGWKAPGRATTRSRVSPTSGGSGWKEDGDRRGGIVNLGNTCYLGAALQALLGNREFVSDIQTRVRAVGKSAAPFANALAVMVGSLEKDGVARLNPELVRSAISAHFKEFGTAAQQDVQEFIMRCFFVLERELGSVVTRCAVSRNFSLVLENHHACTSCGYKFVPRCELFRDISIDIPPPKEALSDEDAALIAAVDKASADKRVADALGVIDIDAEDDLTSSEPAKAETEVDRAPLLQDLVRNYFATQELELNCDAKDCAGNQVTKDSSIVLAPRVLVLHLKRFRVESRGSSGFSLVKVSEPVRIPETLDISSLLAPDVSGPALFDQVAEQQLKDVDRPAAENGSTQPAAVKRQSHSVPGRSRCYPLSPTAETVADVDLSDGKDVSSADDSDKEAVQDLTSFSPVRCFNLDSDSSQIASPANTQAPTVGRNRSAGNNVAFPVTIPANPSSSACTGASGIKSRCIFKIVGDVDEKNGDGVAKGGTGGKSAPVAGDTTVHIDDSADDVEETEEVQDFEPTQAAAAKPAPLKRATNEGDVAELVSRCNVPENVARAALAKASYNITRAAGLLLDSESTDGAVSNVLDLLQQTGDSGNTSKPSGKYVLTAVVRHCSLVAEYGHYVSDIRQADGSWVCFDDQSADSCGDRPFELEDRMRDGYMFFYSSL